MNTGGPAFPVPDSHDANGQVQYGTYGMTLLDWMAGQALAAFVTAYSKDMHKQAIEDGVDPSDSTYLPEFFDEACLWDSVPKAAYALAEAMLAEKARREADHSEDTRGKVDHSPDAGKMAALEQSNSELVEALDNIIDGWVDRNDDAELATKARAIIAKHKATQ